jgi:hypothetical protein
MQSTADLPFLSHACKQAPQVNKCCCPRARLHLFMGTLSAAATAAHSQVSCASAIAPGPTVAAFAAALGEELRGVDAALDALQQGFEAAPAAGDASLLALEAAVQARSAGYLPSALHVTFQPISCCWRKRSRRCCRWPAS